MSAIAVVVEAGILFHIFCRYFSDLTNLFTSTHSKYCARMNESISLSLLKSFQAIWNLYWFFHSKTRYNFHLKRLKRQKSLKYRIFAVKNTKWTEICRVKDFQKWYSDFWHLKDFQRDTPTSEASIIFLGLTKSVFNASPTTEEPFKNILFRKI